MKPIKDYEGLYSVTKDGRVWSHPKPFGTTQMTKGAWLSIGDNGNGYKTVNLWKNNKGKTSYVHRLVAQAYIQNPLNKRTVNHKDGVKENNHVDNLEWNTYSENLTHAFRVLGREYTDKQRESASKARTKYNTNRRRLTPEDVRFIRSSNLGASELGRMFNMAYQAMQNIRKFRTYKDIV